MRTMSVCRFSYLLLIWLYICLISSISKSTECILELYSSWNKYVHQRGPRAVFFTFKGSTKAVLGYFGRLQRQPARCWHQPHSVDGFYLFNRHLWFLDRCKQHRCGGMIWNLTRKHTHTHREHTHSTHCKIPTKIKVASPANPKSTVVCIMNISTYEPP